MAKVLLVIADKYTIQSDLVDIVQSNLRGNDCTIWSNTPVSEDLLKTGARVIGPGYGKSHSTQDGINWTEFGRVLTFLSLTLKALHRLLWSPLTCAWRLNNRKSRVEESDFDVIMAADAQAILSLWVFGRRYSKSQLLSGKKIIS